jgi:hypothetical protein
LVSVSENTTNLSRKDSITITSQNGITKVISFYQAASPTYLTISDSTLEVPAKQSYSSYWDKIILTYSNEGSVATCPASWVKLTTYSDHYMYQGYRHDSVQVLVEENTTNAIRTAIITIRTTDSLVTKYVYITQAAGAKTLSVSSTQLQLTESAQSKTMSLASNANWSASSNNSWITLNKSNGTGNDSITITVTKNTGSQTRTGSVKVMLSDSSIAKTITIIQTPDTNQLLSVNETSLNFASNASTRYLHINSNSSWNVTSASSWLSINKTLGTNSDSILVSVSENPTNLSRKDSITITSQNGITKVISFYQTASPTYLTISDSTLEVPAKQSYSSYWDKIILTYSNEGSVATCPASWVKLTTYSDHYMYQGYRHDSVQVLVEENTTNAIRTAIITIRTTDSLVTRYINITQAAGSSSTLTVSQTNIQANANGETEKVGIGSNSGWVVYPSSSWISINKSTGTGNDSLAITVAKNTGSQSRTGSVKVILQDSSIIKTITIKQSAPTVAVATDTLFFVANSIVNQHVAINTTNPYYFYNGQNSWLTITKNADTLSIAAATNTSSSSRTSTINIYSSDSLLIHIIKVVQYGVTIEKAKSVSISAGTLSSALTSNEAKAVTELTISGTMDVRDFLFIRDSMTSLTKLNLNAVSIALYQGTIDSSLFKSAVTVSFPANTIPANALKGKTTLTEIVLPATLGAIESNAFSGCTNLKSVTLSSNPTVASTAFDNVDKSTCAIVVPSSLVSSYESSSVWNQFSTIKEESTTEIITTTTATDFSIYPNPTKGEVFINGISTNAVIAVYGVNGLFISSEVVKGNKTGLFTNLPQGIYIIKLKDGKQEIARRLIKE